jgi:hypothetical protein
MSTSNVVDTKDIYRCWHCKRIIDVYSIPWEWRYAVVYEDWKGEIKHKFNKSYICTCGKAVGYDQALVTRVYVCKIEC